MARLRRSVNHLQRHRTQTGAAQSGLIFTRHNRARCSSHVVPKAGQHVGRVMLGDQLQALFRAATLFTRLTAATTAGERLIPAPQQTSVGTFR